MNDDLYYCDDDMHYTYDLVNQTSLTDLVLLPLLDYLYSYLYLKVPYYLGYLIY